MNKLLVGGVVGGTLLVGGLYVMNAGGQAEVQMLTEKAALEEKAMMEKEAVMKEEEAMMKEAAMGDEKMMDDETDMMKKEEMEKEEMMMQDDQVVGTEDTMMKKIGLYVPYDASKLVMANSGDVVLFFKASWCPSCRTLDSNIKANLDSIPSDLTILELDYDTATALRQQYGVTTQHTLVQVDASGALVKKWNGGSTLASIVAQVQ